MSNLSMWGSYAFLAAAAALPAILSNWAPWEIIVLAAVLAAAAAVLAGVWAWYALQVRRAELAALSSDDQAARLLGESLSRCGTFLPAATTADVWEVFAAVPSETKRALALAVTGLMAHAEDYQMPAQIEATARSFRPAGERPAPQSGEQAASSLGAALGACEELPEAVVREVWELFAALPEAERGVMASALNGFISAADAGRTDGFDDKILSIARSFRPPASPHGKNPLDELLTPEPVTTGAPGP